MMDCRIKYWSVKAEDFRFLGFESKLAARWSAELSGKILKGLVGDLDCQK